MASTLPFNSIFHPTDFSLTSEGAFAHALKLAVARKAELRVIHYAEQGVDVDWNCFPKVKETLVRWKVLTPDCSKEEMTNLGLHVEGVIATGPDIFSSIFRHLEKKTPDLIVLATHQIDGLNRWLYKPVAEPFARRSSQPTLFVPPVADGCVSFEDGTVNLERILIPTDNHPSPQPAIDATAAWSRILEAKSIECRLFHVGDREDMPSVQLPTQEDLKWEMIASSGQVVDRILEEAADFSPHLIVMVTQGHKGFLDALRGSTTERVLRGARCPVLTIPSE